MCGRFTQTKDRKEVLESLRDIELPPLFYGRYNIAPTQRIPIIRSNKPGHIEDSIWGFDNPKSSGSVINARAETLHKRPMFKSLISSNRCLIPADGFYEWKGKQPYYFQFPDKGLFAFAGLWKKDRCVILTREADQNMQGIHHRMPVILPVNLWKQFLTTFPFTAPVPVLATRPVSRRVNKVINDDPACIKAGDEQTDLFLFPDGE